VRSVLFAIAFFVLSTVASPVAATAQAPDVIVIDSEEYALYSNPLEIWLKDNPEVDVDAIERSDDETICHSSGNWRGYVAKFGIEKNRLILLGIERSACQDDPGKNLVSALFNGEKTVDAKWFSGILVVPTGQRVAYVHLGYGSLYSEYRLFRIEAGRVVAEAKMDAGQYSDYRERQFNAYKRTSAYVQAFADLSKKDSEDLQRMESFLYSVETGYTSDMMLPFPEEASVKK